MAKDTKRENFQVSPEQAEAISYLQAIADLGTRKDAMLLAVRLAIQIVEGISRGKQVYLSKPGFVDSERLLIPVGCSLSGPKYLVPHDHAWKRQLYVKGRKLPASNVWVSMKTNKQTAEEAAHDWDLPIEAIHEIEDYCEKNRDLLQMEAAEEKLRLQKKGMSFEPKNSRR